jgi:hypothetical protein
MILAGFLMMSCLFQKAHPPVGYESFSRLPAEQKTREFAELPISKQVDFFVYEYRYVHPFNMSFAFTIAERSDDPARYLLERIQREKDEKDQVAILYIFKVMFQYYDPQNRTETVLALKQVTTKMKGLQTRESANELLSDIETHSARPN